MLTVQFYLREKLFLVEFHSYTNGTLLLFSCCNTDGCPTVAKQPGKLETTGERGLRINNYGWLFPSCGTHADTTQLPENRLQNLEIHERQLQQIRQYHLIFDDYKWLVKTGEMSVT